VVLVSGGVKSAKERPESGWPVSTGTKIGMYGIYAPARRPLHLWCMERRTLEAHEIGAMLECKNCAPIGRLCEGAHWRPAARSDESCCNCPPHTWAWWPPGGANTPLTVVEGA